MKNRKAPTLSARFEAEGEVITVTTDGPSSFGKVYSVFVNGNLLTFGRTWSEAIEDARGACIGIASNGAPVGKDDI